jgi:putative hemolysin
MLKKYLIAFLVFCILALALFVIRGSEDTWLCVDGAWVKHGNPSAPMPTTGCVPPANTNDNTGLANPASTNCVDRGGELTIKKDGTGGEYGMCVFGNGDECEEWALFRGECQPGIKVVSPIKDEQLISPVVITGTARGVWFFEGVFPVKLVDENDNILAEGLAKAGSEWTTNDYVPFSAELAFGASVTAKGYLIIKNDNPSGLPENDVTLKIPVILPTGETEKVKLFFNNNELDPTVSCNQVFPVERSITKTEAVGRATLEELLKGPSQTDLDYGYYTNLSEGVKIQKLTITDGVAKVDFDEALEKNIGGSCRVSAIRAQITETLKQFPTVKSVIISIDGRTEDILQP